MIITGGYPYYMLQNATFFYSLKIWIDIIERTVN